MGRCRCCPDLHAAGCGMRFDNTKERVQEVVSRGMHNWRLLENLSYARIRGHASTEAEGNFGNESKIWTSNFSPGVPLKADRFSLPESLEPSPYSSVVVQEDFEDLDKYHLVEKEMENKIVLMARHNHGQGFRATQ